VFLTGFVIKMLDDYTDEEFDKLVGSPNITVVLGTGIISYAILFFSLACVLNVEISVSLFLASFSLGMTGNLFVKMPSGLKGYQESLLTTVLGIILFKRQMVAALLLMSSVHLLDDYFDYDNEAFSKKNWAFVLGKVECFLVAAIFFLMSLLIDHLMALSVVISAPSIVYIIKLLSLKITNDFN